MRADRFAELLLISGEQVSPQIVAAAISRVWRKSRFPPSISEFLDECSEMTKAATSTRRVITKMIALRDNAEDALIATGDLPEVRHPSDREGDTPTVPSPGISLVTFLYPAFSFSTSNRFNDGIQARSIAKSLVPPLFGGDEMGRHQEKFQRRTGCGIQGSPAAARSFFNAIYRSACNRGRKARSSCLERSDYPARDGWPTGVAGGSINQ